ncbi:Xylose isomerase OS=Streptomyces fumanus OX=67302 GN=GCM10018772_06150 PE=4 SV=1 [Streptomyces fumanus]
MVGGLQSARSLPHLARAYELADGLGLFPDPKLAEERMRTLLALYGVDLVTDLARFSINQMTVKQLTLPDLAAACRDLGVINVGLWREPVQEYGVAAAAKLVRDAGLTVTTLCRGGFLTATDPEARAGWPTTGGRSTRPPRSAPTPWCWSPGACPRASGAWPPPANASPTRSPNSPPTPGNTASAWPSSRCTPCTRPTAGGLHPDAGPGPRRTLPAHQVGVTVDTYHVWWDDRAPAEIARAGAGGRIHTFQLADWTTPLPEGVLNGRGQLGDGSIDLREWQGHVEAAGYTGPIEVELFNEALWSRDGREVLAETAHRFVTHTAL